MYQVLFHLTLIVCSYTAAYGDRRMSQSVPVREGLFSTQQQMVNPSLSSQFEQNDCVDEDTGSGYSFFERQPISLRPVSQQKFISPDSFDVSDNIAEIPNQWSGYKQSSALTQPIASFNRNQVSLSSTLNRNTIQGGFGQQQNFQVPISAPRMTVSYSQQQQQQDIPILAPTPSMSAGYGQQISISNDDIALPVTYGQQLSNPILPTVTRTISSYSQQQDIPIRTTVPLMSSNFGQQITASNDDIILSGGYDNQENIEVPSLSPSMTVSYGQQRSNPILPPTPRVSAGYGQQIQSTINQDIINSDFDQQQTISLAPTLRTSTGFGLQQGLRTLLPRPRLTSDYGQQQDFLTTAQVPNVNFQSQQITIPRTFSSFSNLEVPPRRVVAVPQAKASFPAASY